MIDRGHDLPLLRQAALLQVSRSCLYYEPRPVAAADLAVMRRIDVLHLDFPFAGSRMLRDLLRGEGVAIGRERVTTLMRHMGIEALYRRPNTSKPEPPPPPTPPEAKSPGIDTAAADRAPAQQTYASKLLAEIRRHRPSVTATGSVVVSFSVGPGGEMGTVSVVRSSAKDELDTAALRMLRAARPEPPPEGHFAGTTTIDFVDR